MFYGGDLNLTTLPFFPLVKDFDVLNSLTCVPVICLQLQSSAFSKVAQHCQGMGESQRRPPSMVNSEGNLANLRTAHEAQMRSTIRSADEKQLSHIPVLWLPMRRGLRGRRMTYDWLHAWYRDAQRPTHAALFNRGPS